MILVVILAGVALVVVLLRQNRNNQSSSSTGFNDSDSGKDEKNENDVVPTTQPPTKAPIPHPTHSPVSSRTTRSPTTPSPTLPPMTLSPTWLPTDTPTEDRLVRMGRDGRLKYSGYANQVGALNPSGTVGGGNSNTVPDFSTAGYQKGDKPIPFVPTAGENATVFPSQGNEDDSQRIQDAIDFVASLPLGENGFRGAVLIKAGVYHVFQPAIQVRESGIVIRGEGSGLTGGTTIWYHFTDPTQGEDKTTLFQLGVATGNGGVVEQHSTRIADDSVAVGETTLTVEDASNFVLGEEIGIVQQVNDDWLLHMSNMAQWDWTTEEYSKRFWRRRIVHMENNTIILDAPIVQAIESKYGGGFVKRFEFRNQISNIGMEGLRLLSSPDTPDDEDHGQYGIRFNRVKNGWVRQVSASFFWGGLVSIKSFSSQITVEDSSMTRHVSLLQGGRRYAFAVDDSEFILVQRCLASHGRHDFATGSQTNGPNVFVDNLSLESYADNGPHHRYSTGLLMDSMKSLRPDASEHSNFHVQNRKGSGSGHGWAGAQVMFWNIEGKIICDSPNGAMNWAVGCVGEIVDDQRWTSISPEEPRGIFQSHGTHITEIRSLFYAQLHDRKGKEDVAYHASFLPQQRNSFIWSELEAWDGDGLFLDPLVTWIDDDALPVTLNAQNKSLPLKIGGIVRDLNLLEAGFGSTWSQLEGPTVSFNDTTQLETTVVFSGRGIHLFGLTVTSISGETSYFAPAIVLV